jgi:hypothetical protein
MMNQTMTNRAFKKAAFYKSGRVRANGPRCATCGDLAALGTHPACGRRNGKLVLQVR